MNPVVSKQIVMEIFGKISNPYFPVFHYLQVITNEMEQQPRREASHKKGL